jgi:hypothetical protein
MALSKVFCLTCGGLLATRGAKLYLGSWKFGRRLSCMCKRRKQPVDSLKKPDFVLNLGGFEVIAVYATAWDPTLCVTLKTLALFFRFYVIPLLCKCLLCYTSTTNSRRRGVRAPNLVFNWFQKFMLLLSHLYGSCNKIRFRMNVIKGQK